MAQPAQKSNQNDNCCQILMCGDGGAGKTALATAFIGGDLHDKDYNPTIHNEYHKSNFMVDGINIGRIDIKDVQGQEEYLQIRLTTISDSDAFILVYDITNKSTFTELNKWITEIKDAKLKENEYKGIPMVIVGMKCDLAHKRAVFIDDVKQLSSQLNDCPFFESCATNKQSINITQVFESAIREWRKYEKYSVTKYENKVKKRKQKSKMENFLIGFGLFSKNDTDENINEPLINQSENENKMDNKIDETMILSEKDKVLVCEEMDSIVEDMFNDQMKAHEMNETNLEKQKAYTEETKEGTNEGKNEMDPSAPDINIEQKKNNNKFGNASNDNDDEKDNNNNDETDLCLYNFKKFLKELKLSKYETVFIENGFGDLEKMLFLDDSDLQSDDFKMKSGERKYLLKKLKELNSDYETFKQWIDSVVKLPVYGQTFCNKGIITMKILIESIDVNNKDTLNALIEFYSHDHLDMFWNRIQEYLHPSQQMTNTFV